MPAGVLAGTKAWWRVAGEGARPMVMLHCTMGHSGAWKGVMAQLSDRFHMVAMDLPEHGRSGPRSQRQSWLAQSAAMAIELIEKTGGPVDLVGHSFGATVAIRIGVDRPDLVRSLTLIEPVFMSAAKDAGREEFTTYTRAPLAFMEHLKAGDREAAARAFSKTWGMPVPWEALPEEQRSYIRDRVEMIPLGGESNMGTGPDYIPLGRVACIGCPVLLVEGGETDDLIRAIDDSLAGALPDAARAVIPGAGHMAPITHPREVAEAIRGFLS